jgi:2-amino-4-hydroxy-6-hydroxymethyldihydropteridine diphosphokinase
VRAANPFAPRTLDVDLLLYGDQVIHDGAVRVPREDITHYSFVLGPLAEIAPGLRHPVTGQSLTDIWAHFDKSRHPIHRVALPPL